MRFHDLLKIIDHKGIRAALERRDQHRISPVGMRDYFCGFQYFGGIVPVQLGEQRLNRRNLLPTIREHVLIKRFNPQRGKYIRNAFVHLLAKHGIRAAQ